MKKSTIFGIAVLAGLAVFAHIGTKKVFSDVNPPPLCKSVFDGASMSYDRANRTMKFKANGHCTSGYTSACLGLTIRYSLWTWNDNTNAWELLNQRYDSVPNPTCGSLIQISTNDYPELYQQYHQINYDLADIESCYQMEVFWNSYLGTDIFTDYTYMHPGDLW